MKIKEFFKTFFKKHFFNPEWQCSICGEENFCGGYVCSKCESKLAYNDGAICMHCGRKVLVSGNYCSTCAEYMTAVDMARSVFSYEGEIRKLIKGLKYDNKRYLADMFAEKLAFLYFKNYFNADLITYIPMTKKAEKRRGYNQSKILAEMVGEKTGVKSVSCIEKVKETKRQAKLKRKERLKNLDGAFRVCDKTAVKGKTVLVVDDVTTTGATAQVIADRLKRAGAEKVYLLTVASTPPIDKY